MMAAAACRSIDVSVGSHPAGSVLRLPRPSLVPSSCLPPLLCLLCHNVRSFWPCGRWLLSVWCRRDACRVAGRFFRLRASLVHRAGPCWSSELHRLNVFDGVCALVGAFWCLDGDIVVFCSSGSSSTAASCISSFCAFVGDFSFFRRYQVLSRWCHCRRSCFPCFRGCLLDLLLQQ